MSHNWKTIEYGFYMVITINVIDGKILESLNKCLEIPELIWIH